MAVGDDDDTVFGDLVEDADALLAAEAVERSVLVAGLRRAVADLPERESKLLTLRYGLADGRMRSLEEVGRELGLTRERIRQLEKETLLRLRETGAAG
jgi:RNA polymerase primary sigma factor